MYKLSWPERQEVLQQGKKNIRGQGFGKENSGPGLTFMFTAANAKSSFLLFKSFGQCSGFSFHPGECKKLLAQPAFCPRKYSDINI